MKSRSYNKITMLAHATTAILLVVALWPAIGHSQSSDRRDRFRREAMSRLSERRTETARPTSAQSQPATQPSPAARRPLAKSEPNAPAPPVEPPPIRRVTGDEQWTKYDLILNRNIFSRLRRPAPSREAVVERPRVVPNPESYYLLKGLVQEDNEFLAFVEDTQGGSVLRLRQGHRVARGTVKSLTLDALEYELEGKTVTVRIGSDLEGGHGGVTTSDLLNWSATSAPAATTQQGAAQPAPSADEAGILKRLIEQRKQQLGQ